jgi:rhamnose transport system substrate-binding protein
MKRYDRIEAVPFGLGRGSNAINRRCWAISVCMLIGAYSLFSCPDSTFGQTKKIGMLPKFTSDPYFVAVNQGAQEAAKELNVTVEFNGPLDANVAAQADIIDKWIRSGMNAITVSENDPNALAPAMERAARRGMKVATFDADVKPEARQVFLNQCTFEGMGKTMVDMMVKDAGPAGDFLVVTAVLTAPNQNRWIEEVKKYAGEKYPKMHIAAVLPGEEDLEKSKNVALNYLRANPNTKGVFCVTGIATPGVAEAVKQLNLKGKVAVTGLGVPSLVRPYIKDGTIKEVALWNPVDIGYGGIYISKAQLDGTLKPESGFVEAGRLGKLKFIAKDVVLLGDPLIFNTSNIDNFKF